MRHVSDWTLDDGSLLLNFSDEVLVLLCHKK